MRRASSAVSVFLALLLLGLPSLDAQVRPVYDLGASGLSHLLQRLQTTASALHTGAHPDDEDSAFLYRHKSHLTERGWIFYNRALDDFFHKRIPRT